jgi:hypothetical protein
VVKNNGLSYHMKSGVWSRIMGYCYFIIQGHGMKNECSFSNTSLPVSSSKTDRGRIPMVKSQMLSETSKFHKLEELLMSPGSFRIVTNLQFLCPQGR